MYEPASSIRRDDATFMFASVPSPDGAFQTPVLIFGFKVWRNGFCPLVGLVFFFMRGEAFIFNLLNDISSGIKRLSSELLNGAESCLTKLRRIARGLR
jgi:hypothetical protein